VEKFRSTGSNNQIMNRLRAPPRPRPIFHLYFRFVAKRRPLLPTPTTSRRVLLPTPTETWKTPSTRLKITASKNNRFVWLTRKCPRPIPKPNIGVINPSVLADSEIQRTSSTATYVPDIRKVVLNSSSRVSRA